MAAVSPHRGYFESQYEQWTTAELYGATVLWKIGSKLCGAS